MAEIEAADWSQKIASVKIYPTIGIARVGNSKHGSFYGPEVPGYFKEPEGGFKDSDGAVKRQAARFRVYAFDSNGRVLGELNDASGYYLKWTVQVANKKPAWYTFMEGAFQPGYTTLRNPLIQPDLPPDQRDKLIVDSGPQIAEGPSAETVKLEGQFYGSKDKPTKVYLGEAKTDEMGRLVVLAGRGHSHSVANENEPYPLILTDFDSPDWVDDTSDGWIDVEVRNKTYPRFKPAHKARIIGTTPKFANGIYAPTSLYDVIEDVYEAQKRSQNGYDVGDLEWYKDIWSLLKRPALLSWVNGQANGGHGPNGPGNFFDKDWQASLSDYSAANLAIRKGVLGRMRLPETNSKYDQARAGQAYPYFMPWLSGDNGRTTAGDPSTFSSVTELQYDRLVKWSDGHFKVDPNASKPPYTNFSDIPLKEQPAALIRASLEHTIGSPLYPGIELSWNAELSETYNLAEPFTVNDSVQPGDLTKFLSLPWQSDFYMCRSYWWPSARPDAIVTEDEYKRIAKSFKPADIAKKLTKRVPWERGIHQNYTGMLLLCMLNYTTTNVLILFHRCIWGPTSVRKHGHGKELETPRLHCRASLPIRLSYLC
ncbi:hypothetical protein BDQ17DRAFT_1242961 [Cyathus striatus]|nr:hypothetical protein BDQ17DRAFT_1242961 [Cyathus striatus]